MLINISDNHRTELASMCLEYPTPQHTKWGLRRGDVGHERT